MKMKRVSFKVAKAIKEAGYPQHNQLITDIGWYNMAGIYTNQLPTHWEGDNMFVAVAPTYLEVWLWLWKEKNIKFSIEPNDNLSECYTTDLGYLISEFGDDPEEVIVSAIEYLADSDLIK